MKMNERPSARAEMPLRSMAVVSYMVSIAAMSTNWMLNGRPFDLVPLICIEIFTLSLIVAAHRAERRDMSLPQMTAAVFTSFFFVLLQPEANRAIVAEVVASSLEVGGLLLATAAKFAIGRSFGILPAARGLRTGGPYRFVRHPMYAGYLLGNLGFLLAHANARNTAVVLGLVAVQVLRIRSEERVLAASSEAEAWQAYRRRVAYRLLPRIY